MEREERKRKPYKTYLLTGEKPPRQTVHSQKKKSQQFPKQQKVNIGQPPRLENVDNLPDNRAFVGQSEQLVQVSPGNSIDTTTDDDDECQEDRRRVKLRRKRKVTSSERVSDSTAASSDDAPFSSDSSPEAGPLSSPHSSDLQTGVKNASRLQECEVLHAEFSDDCQDNSSAESDKQFSEPLCPCIKVTVGELLFMTSTLGLRHGLSWAAQVDILKMMRTVFGDKKIPISKATYIKKLNSVEDSDIQHHVYCPTCHNYLGKTKNIERYCGGCKKIYHMGQDDEICENCAIPLLEREVKIGVKVCSNKLCNTKVDVGQADNLFVSVSIESQLKKFVKDEKFVNNVMKYRFDRQYFPGVYSDIYDGAMYQKYVVNDGILSSPYNLSYTFFTDGIKYGQSSVKTIWPIYLSINELPYEERSKYFILAGVYCGCKDPNQNWFLEPFVCEANKLSAQGFQWIHEGRNVISFVIPLCFVADSVARYQMLNRQSFFAFYGCTFCYQQTVARGAQKFVTDFDAEPSPDRTDASHKYDLEIVKDILVTETQENKRNFRGVKGACALDSLNYFSVTDACVVDYMHCILSGVVKHHMEVILDPKRKHFWNNMKENHGMGHLITTIDKIIVNIQSTTSVIRELRPLKDIASWKASEFRSWLLFYCIVCLKGFLKEKHLQHLALLSKGAHLLLQKTVTHSHIECAFRLFKMYMLNCQELFGDEHMFYNTHLLSHIPKCVLNFGPIWGHNSFTFESENGHIAKLCKSPHFVSFQVARKYLIHQSLPFVCSKMVRTKDVLEYCDKILHYKHLVRFNRASDKNCVLLGSPMYSKLPPEDILKLSELIQNCTVDYCFMYERMYYRRKRYTTSQYGKEKQNNDSFAYLDDGECVKILKIVQYPVGKKVILFVQKVNVDRKPIVEIHCTTYDNLKRATESNVKYLVNVERLDSPCFNLMINERQFVASVPYGCTVE
ncbi:Replication protein 1a [Frankliniella fusca]|uniref:Replication protein 1a n=1 Tax=Frankliniella fusca TaxID=407009 RepID=A0AAE1HGY2_9NEOP|nr:Replication protein 1a [Frankliniella fusca]